MLKGAQAAGVEFLSIQAQDFIEDIRILAIPRQWIDS